MPFAAKISHLNRHTLLFPLALVLFEFAVYIANDMAQPAMLMVTQEFGASAAWVPLSMTWFIIGGAALSWLTGPLSDRIGRRPVMLTGVLFFIISSLATYLVHDIYSFMLLRLIQGMGLSLISAVGYAAVQETFEEIAAIRVTALMANVALLAPMVGPLAGAALIQVAPWRSCFLLIAVIGLISLTGLWKTMPETVNPDTPKAPIARIFHEYIDLFSQSHFMLAALTIPLLSMPLIGWIALSPVLLVNDFGLSLLGYGLWQLPILGSLLIGNFCLAHVAGRWPLGRSVQIGFIPVLLGLGLCLLSVILPQHALPLLVAGISIIAFAEGLSMAVLYRFALMASPQSKGTVSAGMAVLSMLCYALGIEILRLAYLTWQMNGFTLAMSALVLVYLLMAKPLIRNEMRLRAKEVAT